MPKINSEIPVEGDELTSESVNNAFDGWSDALVTDVNIREEGLDRRVFELRTSRAEVPNRFWAHEKNIEPTSGYDRMCGKSVGVRAGTGSTSGDGATGWIVPEFASSRFEYREGASSNTPVIGPFPYRLSHAGDPTAGAEGGSDFGPTHSGLIVRCSMEWSVTLRQVSISEAVHGRYSHSKVGFRLAWKCPELDSVWRPIRGTKRKFEVSNFFDIRHHLYYFGDGSHSHNATILDKVKYANTGGHHIKSTTISTAFGDWYNGMSLIGKADYNLWSKLFLDKERVSLYFRLEAQNYGPEHLPATLGSGSSNLLMRNCNLHACTFKR